MVASWSQECLAQAVADVRGVEALGRPVATVYGGLCHEFPLMLMSLGLAQTVGYCRAKATVAEPSEPPKPENLAYQTFLRHMAGVLALGETDLFDFAREADLSGYLWATRRLLKAGVFYKHLAVSVLKVEAGDEADEAAGSRSGDEVAETPHA